MRATISIHALLAESDNLWDAHRVKVYKFLSTLSLRRATDQNSGTSYSINISIHALLAESDVVGKRPRSIILNFYPRSPCGERPRRGASESIGTLHFYPRSPCGERRGSPPPCGHPTRDFYPRSPCGERQRAERHASSQQEFLSTLSLRRATVIREPATRRHDKFLSTLSLRRATPNKSRIRNRNRDFYPRSPCGERPCPFLQSECPFAISIHALLAESDSSSWSATATLQHFYPRSPCGERQM